MKRIVFLLILAACGRPLTDNEAAFTTLLQGAEAPVNARITEGVWSLPPREIRVPPRLTCQQRIWPPLEGPTVMVRTNAMVLFEQLYVRDTIYQPDFLPEYPDEIYLPDAMLLAHEMVHVWQWQQRDLTGYHPALAAFEHRGGRDPYLFDPETQAPFLSFGYEQQGSIMEEYVCCRALAPQAERTTRLHGMLSEVFDLPPLDRPLARSILLPWDGVQIEGICDPEYTG